MITFSTDSPYCMNHGIGVYLFHLIVSGKELPNKLYLDWNEPDETKRVSNKIFVGKQSTRPQIVDGESYAIYANAKSATCLPLALLNTAEQNGFGLQSDNIHMGYND